jgi:hypothetical protein
MALALVLLAATAQAAKNPATGDSADYIPKDVPDAVRVLKASLTKDELKGVLDPRNTDNFFLGVGLRNSWGLWGKSRLLDYFHAHGVTEPEEMSGIILDALVADLQHKSFDVEGALAKARADEREAVKEEQDNQRLADESVARIKTMMLGLRVTGKPAQTVTMPKRINPDGVRVRYMAPWAGGYLVMSEAVDETNHWSEAYFLDLDKRTLRKIRVPGLSDVWSGIVLAGQAYFTGTGGNAIVAADGKTIRTVAPPPGKGALRLGRDGDHLLAFRPRGIYRRDGDGWTTLLETKADLPAALVPPEKFGNRIYLRDEGHDEDNKQLWLIDLAHRRMTTFDRACQVVGPEGPRWENVWSYAVDGAGQVWLAPGYSLVRGDEDGGYRVALMNGHAEFDGQLMEGIEPQDSPLPDGWSAAGTGAEKQAPLAACGITVLPDGKTVMVIGPNGLFQIADGAITPLLAFRNMAQLVTMKELNPYTKEPNQYHWSVDPTHLVPLPNGAFLIGNHWEGVYLLAKDGQGRYGFTSLDEKLGPDVMLQEILGRR